ncbi:hypothetical protein [Methylocystis sp.]|uniref:hypothetical protein n=1 Tax=Methylocystis sp. TaxID=1911079 RepID=UPI003D125868
MKINQGFMLAALLASGSVQAASLEGVRGDVWIGRDKGFSLVNGSTELSPGDKIKAGRKGAARLVYSDGCSVNVGANSLTRVAKHSPCSFNAQFVDPSSGGSEWVGIGLGLATAGGGLAAGLASIHSGSTNYVPVPVSTVSSAPPGSPGPASP